MEGDFNILEYRKKQRRVWWCCLIVLLVAGLILVVSGLASAQDWELQTPSRAPMYFSYELGAYLNPEIYEGAALKKFAAEGLRTKLIPPPRPNGSPNYGSMGDEGQKICSIMQPISYKGAMAFTNSFIRAKWDYIAPGQTFNRPTYSLDWVIENKCSSPDAPPTLRARGYGAVAGVVSQTYRVKGAEANQKYALPLRLEFSGKYTEKPDAAVRAGLSAVMIFRCGGIDGLSEITVYFDHTGGSENDGAWIMNRRTQQSSGQFYERQYIFEGTEFSKVISVYPKMGGAMNRITPFAIVGRIDRGKGVSNTVGWKNLSTSSPHTTVMDSSAYPPNVTGGENRDDKWEGKISIQPRVPVKH